MAEHHISLELDGDRVVAVGALHPQPGWTSPDQDARYNSEYESELIRRFETGQFLTATDKRDARRLIAARRGGE